MCAFVGHIITMNHNAWNGKRKIFCTCYTIPAYWNELFDILKLNTKMNKFTNCHKIDCMKISWLFQNLVNGLMYLFEVFRFKNVWNSRLEKCPFEVKITLASSSFDIRLWQNYDKTNLNTSNKYILKNKSIN